MRYDIDFSPSARVHLKALRKRDQQIILDAIAKQLTHEPTQPTNNRKKLENNALAPWELRVRKFRVFYDVEPENMRVVVLAVGEKDHNQLRIGGEEVKLERGLSGTNGADRS